MSYGDLVSSIGYDDSCILFADYFTSMYENGLNSTVDFTCLDNIDSPLNFSDLILSLFYSFTSIDKLKVNK